jgi:serine protease Do
MKITPTKCVLLALVALLGGAAAWVASSSAFEKSPGKRPSVSISVNNSPLARETKLTSSFAPVTKRVAPTVVNVFTTKTVRNQMPGITPFFDDPFFRRFFGQPFGDNGGRRAPQTFKERSLGSGVIVTKDGYILTNNHVVDGADEIKVALAKDKKQYTAKVVGRDPRTDIAVLKIDAKDAPFITFADSDQIEVGDIVLALGNPFGIGQTVTMGIVSATGRGGMGIEDYEDFIQTDAAINPGNSGGALVDAEGRLIGINTAILSRTGGSQGVGFAIPANLVRSVMDQIIEKGKVERGILGVRIQDATPELARQFNVPENTSGALIGEVTEKSAAAEAGLKIGDLIVDLNGTPVKDSRNLKLMVGRLAPGDKVAVKVLRDGKEKTFTVTLKEMPEEKLASADKGSDGNDSDALNGVAVGEIDSAARRQFNIPDRVNGALITDVDQNSASYDAGLRPGDVIQEIDRKRVSSADEAVEASKHVQTREVLVRIWSQGGSRYVVVDEGKSR